ncbi:MAG: acyl-ACP--UDP-N-acetylglucosamine O-acyltransferase [Planctomycetota bacterium]
MTVSIHPTAVVHTTAEFDADVSVGPYCVVGPHVRVGRGSILHNHVTIQGCTTLGEDNVVFPFAVLGAEPQDLKYEGRDTELVIGDRNKIREHATIHRGTELGGYKTMIGSDCLVMVGVHIAHDCVIEDEVVIANGSMLGGHCLVEFGAAIGGGAGLHHFTTVGTLAFVGGMSRISKDVAPYVVVEGTPAEARKINTTALMRRKWQPEEIERLREAFRMIFRSHDVPAAVALERLRATPDQSRAVIRLCDFAERAQLGVHGRHRELLRERDVDRRDD